MGNAQHDYKQRRDTKGKSATTTRNKTSFANFKFVQYTPTAADKAALRQRNSDPAYVVGELFTLVGEGYKLSLSFKSDGSVYTATLSCNDGESPNSGLLLTGRGADPITALTWLHYLHYIRFEGTWLNDEEATWDLE